MYNPITKSHNYPTNLHPLQTSNQNQPPSPNRIIQDIMYTPHQTPSSSVLQSRRKNSKHFSLYNHSFNNNDDNDTPYKQTPQSHLTKKSPKRLSNFKPSKFDMNTDNDNNNNEMAYLVKTYSSNYNIGQFNANKALANVEPSPNKHNNNLFFLNKKVSVNETLQNKSLQKIKMIYIQNPNQPSTNIRSSNIKRNSVVFIDNNNNNNYSSKTVTAKRHHTTRNKHNLNNNNVLVMNQFGFNDIDKNGHHDNNASKKQSKYVLETDPQGSTLCFLRTSNSDTIKTRKKFSKSKTRKKNHKFSPQHGDILNMKDILEEIQSEVEPIKVCKTVQKKTVESREEKNENKILTVTTLSGNTNKKGFFCKCIPFCRNNKIVK